MSRCRAYTPNLWPPRRCRQASGHGRAHDDGQGVYWIGAEPPPPPASVEDLGGRLHVSLRVAARAFTEQMEQMRRAVEELGRSLNRLKRGWPRVELVVEDPYDRRPTTVRGVLAQMRDIVLHEFWTGVERPERSPGARWVLVGKRHERRGDR